MLKKVLTTLFVVVLTTIVVYFFGQLSPNWLGLFGAAYGYGIGWILSMVVLMLTSMAATLPGMLLLRLRKVPNYIGISMLADAESFWLSWGIYTVTLTAMASLGAVIWLISKFITVVLSYVLASVLFNAWDTRLRKKVIVAGGIVVLTALGSEIILRISWSS
jgi:hypothetical protein